MASVSRVALQSVLTVSCVAGAFFSGIQAYGRYLEHTSPEKALLLTPNNPQLLTRLADALFAADQQAAAKGQLADTSKRQVALARRALRHQVLLPKAIRQIGMATSNSRFDAYTRQYMKLAERLSRRETLTQLWLAEDALSLNHINDGIAHLDAIFRTNTGARDVIWPVLIRSGDLPQMGPALAQRSDQGAGWVSQYLHFLLGRGVQLQTIARTLAAIKRPDRLWDGAGLVTDTTLLLASSGKPADARKLFESARRNKLLESPGDLFAGEGTASLGWKLYGFADAEAQWRGANRQARSLDLFAEGGARRTVARQVRFDPPGPYRWVGRIDQPTLPAGSSVELSMTCGGSTAAQTVWIASSRSNAAQPLYQTHLFTLGAACPVQVYSLNLIGSETSATMTASIQGLAPHSVSNK